MPPRAKPTVRVPLFLIAGEEEFSVKKRARELFDTWRGEGGAEEEIIDAQAGNSAEALQAVARLRESLQTLPFFNPKKIVWFRHCTFLADDRTGGAQAVTESVRSLAEELSEMPWDNVRLLISAGKVDRKRVFYKTIDRIGTVEWFDPLSLEDRDWPQRAAEFAREQLQGLGKTIQRGGLDLLVQGTGPNLRLLQSEIEKLSLYSGDRPEITADDVAAIAVRNPQAKAFALADRLAHRDLPGLLSHLQRELWSMKTDSQKSVMGLLYGIISKVRAMLFVKALAAAGIKPARDYSRFSSQLEGVVQKWPLDRKFSPLSMNPYVLYLASQEMEKYSEQELIQALELLLECNQKLVSSALDSSIWLQQTLAKIAAPSRENATG